MPSPRTAGRVLERGDLGGERLVALRRPLLAVQAALDRRQVGEHELELEGVEVGARVGVAGHRGVFEGAQDVEDGVAVAQGAEEAVAQPLSGARALHQRGDVDDLEAGVHELLGVRHLAQAVDALVGDLREGDRGLRGGERVRRDHGRRAGQRVEQARLAAVREAHEAETFHCSQATGTPPARVARRGVAPERFHYARRLLRRGRMSKKTAKRKLRSRRNKANHGKRPNSGRR